MNAEKDIYVIVADNDQKVTMPSGTVFTDKDGPLIFEQYVRTADLTNIRKRIQYLNNRYGKCRIAKLQFIGE